MQNESFFNRLMNNLAFPFESPHWVKKVAIGAGLSLAAFIVPIIPMLFVHGYSLRVMRRIISGDGEPTLPEWEDWGKLFTDGLKLWGAAMIYSLPILILLAGGFILLFGAFLLPAFTVRSDGTLPPQTGLLFGAGLIIFMGMILLLVVLGWVISLLQAPALSHLAAKDSFSAAFRFGEWWPIFKKGFAAFLLAVVTVMLLVWVATFAIQILSLTIILIVLLPLLMAIWMFFTVLYTNVFYALAYKDTLAKMNAPV